MKAIVFSLLLLASTGTTVSTFSYLRGEERAKYEIEIQKDREEIERLTAKTDSVNTAYLNLRKEVDDLKKDIVYHPFGRDGSKAYPASPFGVRYHPTLKERLMHEGTDFGHQGGVGQAIVAVKPGIVISANWLGKSAGLTVRVDHGKDPLTGEGTITQYLHLSDLRVARGDTVLAGQELGGMGSAGTGPHLHIEYLVFDEETQKYVKKDLMEEKKYFYTGDRTIASL